MTKQTKWLSAVMLCMGMIGQNMLGVPAHATEDPIKVTVDSLENVRGNGAMEACGTAVHKDGVKPLMVTVKHDESFYTVLTGANTKWCVLIMRWTFDGKIDVSATTLQKAGVANWQSFDVSQFDIK